MTDTIAHRVRRWIMPLLGRPVPARVEDVFGLHRANYKRIWNTMSRTDRAARIAVAGHADDEISKRSAQDAVAILREHVHISPEDVVLEIGAGYGRIGAELAPMCREWIGVDVSENMVGHMRSRLAHLPNVRLVANSGHDLEGVPSSSVDVVYCVVVFMHIDEWDRYNYVLDGFRVLRPGGRLLIDNINLCSDGGWAIFEEHRSLRPDRRPPHISKTSTPEEMHAYFSRAGFSDIRQAEVAHLTITTGVKPA